MLKKLVSYVFILAFVASCASGHQKTSVQLRQFVSQGKYGEAIKFLKESALAKDEKSKLLYHIELGLLQHYHGDLDASNTSLSRARELIDELFTTRVSGKISSFASNDNADLYYGEKYEASLVFFYLALNHYMQAVKESDEGLRKVYLEKARAHVVGWDSFITEMKNDRLGKALFKEDLLAKTFGALVHESQGNYKDDQIALQLYKDAQGVFFKNYNLYPTFNASYEAFRKNFDLFPKLSMKEVEGKYVLATEHSNSFQDFLKNKIAFLSSKLGKRPHGKLGHISFLVQDGIIAEKIPKEIEIPMAWGAHSSMAVTMGMSQKITFELPTLKTPEHLEIARLEALDKEGRVLYESNLSVIAPLSELAEQAINEHSSSVAAKTAARVTTKHLTALAAAAVTYEAGRSQNNSITMMLASVGHAAAVASINASEKADVRFWSTLPSNIRMGHIEVPYGTYRFRAVFGPKDATNYRVMELGVHEVNNQSKNFVMNNEFFKEKKQALPLEETPVIANEKGIQRKLSSEKN